MTLHTEAARKLLAAIEHLGYDAYDAARWVKDGQDWEEALTAIEQEAFLIGNMSEEMRQIATVEKLRPQHDTLSAQFVVSRPITATAIEQRPLAKPRSVVPGVLYYHCLSCNEIISAAEKAEHLAHHEVAAP